jgi:hypothetical protein
MTEQDIPSEELFLAKLATSKIPWHLHNGLARWVCFGIQPGGFLTAVVTNDLFDAVTKGDDEAVEALPNTVRWLYWNTPNGCRGSDKVLDTWPLYVQAEKRKQEGRP